MCLNKKLQMLVSDPAPCSYINTLALGGWGGGGGQEAGSTYITQLLFMAHNALHFLSQHYTYTHSTAQHIKAIIGIGAPQAVLHNDMSTLSVHPNHQSSKTEG